MMGHLANGGYAVTGSDTASRAPLGAARRAGEQAGSDLAAALATFEEDARAGRTRFAYRNLFVYAAWDRYNRQAHADEFTAFLAGMAQMLPPADRPRP
jgi:hypothetical protein